MNQFLRKLVSLVGWAASTTEDKGVTTQSPVLLLVPSVVPFNKRAPAGPWECSDPRPRWGCKAETKKLSHVLPDSLIGGELLILSLLII